MSIVKDKWEIINYRKESFNIPKKANKLSEQTWCFVINEAFSLLFFIDLINTWVRQGYVGSNKCTELGDCVLLVNQIH